MTDDAGREPTRGSLRQLLQVRDFRLYFLGQVTSVSGNWMQIVAIAVLVLDLTGSGFWLGAAMACRSAPLLLLSLWGGVVADRVAKRTIVLIASAAGGVLALGLGVSVVLSASSIPLIIVISALMGCANAFDNPARQAWVSEIVDESLLHGAVRLNSTLISIARIVGPLIAAFVIARWSLGWCFILNAASFGVVALCAVLMRQSRHETPDLVERMPGQIREGLRHVVQTPALAGPMVMVAITGALTWEFPVTLPLMSEFVFDSDASVYAWMMAFMGIGAIASGLIGASRPVPTHRSLNLSASGWGITIVAAALAPSLELMCGLLILVGYASVSFSSNAKTILQLCARPDTRGRVMALWAIAWLGSSALGAPLIGWIGEVFGARAALLIGGLIALICGAAGFLYMGGGRARDRGCEA